MANVLHEESSAEIESTGSRLKLVFIASAFVLGGAVLPYLRPTQAAMGDLLALIGALVIAAPILIDTITAIRARGFEATQFYMDQYVILALGACLATGKYITGGIVAIILVVGQMLEERTVVGVEMALSRLRELSKVRARRVTEAGVEEETESEHLEVGDRIRVRPGDVIPADATVLTGRSLVNQASITGESLPVEIEPGKEIFAGTTNLDGLIEAEVTGAGANTLVSKVQQIIEGAKNSEAPIIRMAEDYARYYTPLVLLIAACVFFFTQDIDRAIAVLIVSIPCAFVLASPSAMVAAIAVASRLGMLVKSARNLEVGHGIDTVVFDKTGTLTKGNLSVEEVILHRASRGYSNDSLLAIAGAMEQHSSHPVAQAICTASEHLDRPPLEDLKEISGRGLSARVGADTVLLGRLSWLAESGVELASSGLETARFSLVGLAVNGRHEATLALVDELKPEAAEAIAKLREVGIQHFVMLTGDREPVAREIAAQVGIVSYRSECLPEDKLAEIERLKSEGHRILVVGDGLNDAPALAAGDLSVAMAALGNDVAIHTAGVALMQNDLRRLPDLLELSYRTVNTINQNLLCGFIFIIIAITLSAAGFVNPIVAAFFHEFSAFFVIFNSARLLRFDGLPHAGTAALERNGPVDVEPANGPELRPATA